MQRGEHLHAHPPRLPRLGDARNDLFSANIQGIRFDPAQIPHLATFLRSTGLGFSQDLGDRTTDSEPEVEDLDVGPVGGMALDLDL